MSKNLDILNLIDTYYEQLKKLTDIEFELLYGKPDLTDTANKVSDVTYNLRLIIKEYIN